MAIGITLATVWAFWTSFPGVFVLDDVRAIVRNPTIRTLSPLTVPLVPPGESTVAGRPVANLSFALSYATAPAESRDVFQPPAPGEPAARASAFLDNARSYHAWNLGIHLLAALVLFGVVRRTLLTPKMARRFGSPALWIAAAAAVVWAVHPLQTESVTYIVQRVESLMGLFYLLTLYCAIRAAEGQRTAGWTLATIAFCALGMATKEVMVTAPLTVAAWLHVFRPERRHWRILGGLAATWLVFAVLIAFERREASIAFDLAWRYLLTQSAVIVHYVRLSVVPSPLVFLYDWPLAASVRDVPGPFVAVTAATLATGYALWRRHPIGFVGAWFLLILAPTSSLIPIVTEVAAEHRMYLPLASLTVCAAAGAWLALVRLPPRTAGLVAAAGTMLATLTYGSMTRDRNRDYWSEERLWAQTVAAHPQAQRARVAYGTALVNARRFAEAEQQFRAALERNESDPVAHTRLGSVLAAQNRLSEAQPHFERAVALRPGDVDANRSLGQIYAIQGDDARAVEYLDRAAATWRDPGLLVRLAALLGESRDPAVRDSARARLLAEEAVGLTNRQEPLALEILSSALAGLGRYDEAAAVASEALAIATRQGNPQLAARLESRVRAYRARGRL